MNKKNPILIVAILLACLSAATFIFAKQNPPQKDNLYEQVELFASAVSIIRNDYVKEVEPKSLIYGALNGMLMSLDNHSQFLDPDAYEEMRVETEGKFGGLGIEVTIKDDILTIVTPVDGTPAFKAGLKPNDKIVKIDGRLTRDLTLTESVRMLRGDPGTDVALTILREDEKKLLDFTITRGIIEIKSVKEAVILEPGIGYIKLVEFQENTPKDLAKSLTVLKAKGADSIILDLRNNPGGLLDVSVSTAETFLPRGSIVVSTKGRIKEQNEVFRAGSKRPCTDFPLIVLINDGSASASEIVAGAIKDNSRGILVGEKTFGKGSVQTVIPLGDGSAMRLTTAEYFTPSGKIIQGEGVVPDVVVEGEDAQLKTAVDLIKGIKAYESLKARQKQQ